MTFYSVHLSTGEDQTITIDRDSAEAAKAEVERFLAATGSTAIVVGVSP